MQTGEHTHESFFSEKVRIVWPQEGETRCTVIPAAVMITADSPSEPAIIVCEQVKLHIHAAHGTKMLQGGWTNRPEPRQVEDGLGHASHLCGHRG